MILGLLLSYLIPSISAAETDYQVQRGDTLQLISMKHFGTTRRWQEIYHANATRFLSPNHLRVGQIIQIPGQTQSTVHSSSSSSEVVVKKGDTLAAISRRFLGSEMHWRKIFDLNRDQVPHERKLEVGVRLRLPDGAIDRGLAQASLVVVPEPVAQADSQEKPPGELPFSEMEAP